MRWPVYFATKAVNAPHLKLKVGEQFPIQSKATIQGYGAAFGIPNARSLPFAELPYVGILDVDSADEARRVRELRLSLEEAKRTMKRAA